MSTDATWYLGPLGDLRALTCPEPGITTTVTRYGGVHQALSGARVMDITGHRQEFSFDWESVEETEWNWLEALHLRQIPGPLALLNPLKRNRLSPQASTMKVVRPSQPGVYMPEMTGVLVWDWPSAADPGARSLRVPGYVGPNPVTYIVFDIGRLTPVRVGELITYSVYVKADVAQTVNLYLDCFDRAGLAAASPSGIAKSVTTGWTRISASYTVPAGVATARLGVGLPTGSAAMNVAAPQVESGSLTAWQLGGGSARVLVDQLETSSPRFPLTDCSLTLLEA